MTRDDWMLCLAGILLGWALAPFLDRLVRYALTNPAWRTAGEDPPSEGLWLPPGAVEELHTEARRIAEGEWYATD